MKVYLTLVFSFLFIATTYGQGNAEQLYIKFPGLALTPPMGWNSWNKFQCNVDENMIRQQADAMVLSGMKDAGYTYINIDDCWQGDRDSLGFIHPDAKRFPSGMKALADYVHSKGLKIGIYSDAGSKTCGGRPGSRGYEFQDAMTYAKWGIDYLKYDWCFTEGLKAEGAYKTIAAALQNAGRPILLSICEWGNDSPWIWGPSVAQLWRTTGDIYNCFDCIKDHGSWKSWGIMQILDKQEGLRKYAGPDHWNDPDMLQVGNGMALNEDRAHFSMWAILAAPLIAGNDLRNMSQQTKEILTNKEVIAINQDSMGVQGFRHSIKDSVEVWFKPLSNGSWAVAFLNRNQTKAVTINFNWQEEVINDTLSRAKLDAVKTVYKVRNVWTKQDAGNTKNALSVSVPAHDVLMVRLNK